MQLPKIPGVASLASGTMIHFGITLRVSGANGFVFAKEIIAGEEVSLEVPTGPLSFTAGYMGILMPPGATQADLCSKMNLSGEPSGFSLGMDGGPSIYYAKAEKLVEPSSGSVVSLAFGPAVAAQNAMFGIQVFSAPNVPASGAYMRFADPATHVGYSGPCPGQEFRKPVEADGRVSGDFPALGGGFEFIIESPQGKHNFVGPISLADQGRNLFVANLFDPSVALKPQSGSGDFDGDGLSNQSEWTARSNPFDAVYLTADSIGCDSWNGKFVCGAKNMDSFGLICKLDGTVYTCGDQFCFSKDPSNCGAPAFGPHTLQVSGSDRYGFVVPTVSRVINWYGGGDGSVGNTATPAAELLYPQGSNVDPLSRIYVRFNREVTSGRFEILDSTGNTSCAGVAGTMNEKSSLICLPTSGLAPNRAYTISVKDLVLAGGVTISEPISWSFTTKIDHGMPAQIQKFYPNASEGIIGRDPNFSFELSRPISPSSVNGANAIILKMDDGTLLNKSCSYRDDACGDHWHYNVYCNVTSGLVNGMLPAGRKFIVDVNSSSADTATLRDGKGQPLLSPLTRYSFVSGGVAGSVDTTPPTIARRFPILGAQDARADTLIAAFFDEPIAGNQNWNSVVLVGADNLPRSMNWCETWNGIAIVCKPSESLNVGSTYTVNVSNVRDLNGNMIVATSWNFKVGVAQSIERVALFKVPDDNELPRTLFGMRVGIFFNSMLDYSTTLSAGSGANELITADSSYFAQVTPAPSPTPDFYTKGYRMDLKNFSISKQIQITGVAPTPYPSVTATPRPILSAVVPNPTPGAISWEIGDITKVPLKVVARFPNPGETVSMNSQIAVGFNKVINSLSTYNIDPALNELRLYSVASDGTKTPIPTSSCDGSTGSSDVTAPYFRVKCMNGALTSGGNYRVEISIARGTYETISEAWEFKVEAAPIPPHVLSVSPSPGEVKGEGWCAPSGIISTEISVQLPTYMYDLALSVNDVTGAPLSGVSCTPMGNYEQGDGTYKQRFQCGGLASNTIFRLNLSSISPLIPYSWVFKTGSFNSTCGVPEISYSPNTIFGMTENNVNALPLLNTKGYTVNSCSITPQLPPGLAIGNYDCRISGVPIQASISKSYTVTVSTLGGVSTTNVTLGVVGVPRISMGGVETVSPAVDDSGLTTAIAQPSVVCGLTGTLSERVADCSVKNGSGAEVKDSALLKYWWQLVSNGGTGKVVWLDKLTGLTWSDVVSTTENWCRASGSNNRAGSALAESDTAGYCSGGVYQDQTAPVSLCAEHPLLVTPTVSQEAKGALAVAWWLPSIEDLRIAVLHGAAKVLPQFSSNYWWSATINSSNRSFGWLIWGGTGAVYGDVYRLGANGVRCVGAE